mgnify:CR=1
MKAGCSIVSNDVTTRKKGKWEREYSKYLEGNYGTNHNLVRILREDICKYNKYENYKLVSRYYSNSRRGASNAHGPGGKVFYLRSVRSDEVPRHDAICEYWIAVPRVNLTRVTECDICFDIPYSFSRASVLNPFSVFAGFSHRIFFKVSSSLHLFPTVIFHCDFTFSLLNSLQTHYLQGPQKQATTSST